MAILATFHNRREGCQVSADPWQSRFPRSSGQTREGCHWPGCCVGSLLPRCLVPPEGADRSVEEDGEVRWAGSLAPQPDQAPIDGEVDASDVRCVVTRQEEHRLGDLDRLGLASQQGLRRTRRPQRRLRLLQRLPG